MIHLLCDIETDGLDYTKIHVVCTKEYETGKTETFTDMFRFWAYVQHLLKKYGRIIWVFHNGVAFDVDAINELTDVRIELEDVLDTFILSRLYDYNKFNTHSLKEIGKFLGVYKGDFDGPWDVCTQDMVDYCEQDVEVTEAIFVYLQPLINDSSQSQAIQTEHEIARVCKQMELNGFEFDTDSAVNMLDSINKEMSELEDGFNRFISSRRVEDRRIKYRKNKDGSVNSRVQTILDTEDCEIVGEEVIVYKQQEFNPGSPKQRVEILNEFGWEPVDKTDGHKKYLREKQGWV